MKGVKKDTYLCSRHFVESSDPTIDNSDPWITKLVENSIKTRKRKPPKDRTNTNNFKKNRNTENNISLSLTDSSMENDCFSFVLNSSLVSTSSFETKLSINETNESSTSIDLSNISPPMAVQNGKFWKCNQTIFVILRKKYLYKKSYISRKNEDKNIL